MIEQEKVYCKTCKYYWLREKFGQYHHYCTHPKNTFFIHKPLEKVAHYTEIERANHNNNCKYFEEYKKEKINFFKELINTILSDFR